MKEFIKEIPLANGLTVRFADATRRYFGDYHQVRVTISCTVPVSADLFESAADFEAARKLLGSEVLYQKKVEHQGVASQDTEAALEKVVQQFISHTLGYFETGTFPRRFVHSELNRLRTRSKIFLSRTNHG